MSKKKTRKNDQVKKAAGQENAVQKSDVKKTVDQKSVVKKSEAKKTEVQKSSAKKSAVLKFREEPVRLFLGLAVLLLLADQSGLLSGSAAAVCKACAIPMIFMGAGMLCLIHEDNDPSDPAQIKKDAKIFLGTYFWFSLINAAVTAVKVIADSSEYRNNRLNDQLFSSFTFYGYSVLWILPVLFVALTVCRTLKNSMSYKWFFAMITCLMIAFGVVYHSGNLHPVNVVIDSGISVQGAGARLAVVFLRSLSAIFFMLVGEGLVMLTDKVDKHRERLLIPGIPLVLAGFVLIALRAGSFYWPTLYFTDMWALIPGAALAATGLWCISVWIGRTGVINYFGENAMFIYLTFFDLGAMQLAKLAGDEVFAFMDNSFASKAAFVVVLTAAELIWIKILSIPVLSFLTGNIKNAGGSILRGGKK